MKKLLVIVMLVISNTLFSQTTKSDMKYYQIESKSIQEKIIDQTLNSINNIREMLINLDIFDYEQQRDYDIIYTMLNNYKADLMIYTKNLDTLNVSDTIKYKKLIEFRYNEEKNKYNKPYLFFIHKYSTIDVENPKCFIYNKGINIISLYQYNSDYTKKLFIEKHPIK